MRRNSGLLRVPRRVPALSLILENLGDPSPSVVAKALGVHFRTVERWKREGRAPRPALLALYYSTTWGRSDVNCQAENDASMYFAYAASLRAELDEAKAQLARLGQVGEFGSANDPAQGVPTKSKRPLAARLAGKKNRAEPSSVAPVSLGKTKRFSHGK